MAKILLADDDPFLTKIYSTKLSQDGHKVVTCADGQTALEIALDLLPDLIVLDIMLPRMNGLDVLSAIKENKKLAHTTVIFLSNLAQEEEQAEALSRGAKQFLIKAKLTPSQVIESIAKYLKPPKSTTPST